ncbi:MAG: hypothetical protein F6K42_13140, partial [Leptolyngbya sp. SIO1D8]|nr:hypothetical protein [Leptolyngbya sp. SIO1D8]
MASSRKRSKRRRGVVLSPEGWQRVQAAQQASELSQNGGNPYTIEQLVVLTGLSTNTLGRLRSSHTPVDRQTIKVYFETFGLTLTPADCSLPASNQSKTGASVADAAETNSQETAASGTSPPTSSATQLLPSSPPPNQQDWGEAIDVSVFHGRTTELATLEQWIERDRCRLIGILGMGGIGKTALSVKLAEQIQPQFEFIIWRSLRNAPSLDLLLSELVPFLSHQQETQPTIRQLLQCLRNARCLLVLDNMETILQAGSQAGYYRPGYENYGDLLRVIGESRHQSCLVITSREKPAEITTFEGIEAAVRSLSLKGSLDIALALVEAQGLSGTLEQKQIISEQYGCSPLALKIVASSIQALFDGNIAQFLAEETTVFYGVRRLLDQQFDRLSALERSIMYWLAINREWTSISELVTDIVPRVARSKIVAALESLSWRSLIEKQSSRYTQQPVVMEYMTDRLVEQVFGEIGNGEQGIGSREQGVGNREQGTGNREQGTGNRESALPLLHSHALLKTTVKDYVRESQVRLILQPIIHQLRTTFGSSSALEEQLQDLLAWLKATHMPGYGAGNLINLIRHLELDLTGYDFSELTVWQAYLQNIDLHQVNFQNADLTRSTFTQTLGRVVSLLFSPDGQLLATGDMDGESRLWQVADGQLVFAFGQHCQAIWGLAFSPDGKILATGSEDHFIRLWDIHSKACLRTLQGPDSVRAISWNLEGNLLASGGDDHLVRLWDAKTGRCTNILHGHTDWIYAVAFSPVRTTSLDAKGEILASASFDQTIRLWDVATQACLQTFQGHSGGIWTIAWSSDGQRLASGSEDTSIKVWDVQSGQCILTLSGHKKTVFSVVWSTDGTSLASCSHDQTIRLWDIPRGQCATTLQRDSNAVFSLAWSPTEALLASGSHDQIVKFWDVPSRKCRRT